MHHNITFIVDDAQQALGIVNKIKNEYQSLDIYNDSNKIILNNNSQNGNNTNKLKLYTEDVEYIKNHIDIENNAQFTIECNHKQQENQGNFFIYKNDRSLLEVFFQEEKMILMKLNNHQEYSLLDYLNKFFAQFPEIYFYEYGLCSIYKNIYTVKNCGTMIIKAFEKYQEKHQDIQFDSRELFLLLMRNFFIIEIKRLEKLLNNTYSQGDNNLIPYRHYLVIAIEIFKNLHKLDVENIKKLKKKNHYLKMLSKALVYEDIFEKCPEIIMQSFSRYNYCFREFCQHLI